MSEETRRPQYWGTISEINFVRKLGSWSSTRTSREQLLGNYLHSMRYRYDWGAVNPSKVRQEVEKLLEQNNLET